MTVTATQTKPRALSQMASGSYLDDAAIAADVVISLGFRPRLVMIFNQSGTCVIWAEGMADASGMKIVGVATTPTASEMTFDTTLQITPSATGFTIGQDTDILVQNEQLRWVAFG